MEAHARSDLSFIGMWNISVIIMWPLHNQSNCNISMKNGSNVIILTHHWILLFMAIRPLGVAGSERFCKISSVDCLFFYICKMQKTKKNIASRKEYEKHYLAVKMDLFHRLLSPATERISFNILHNLRRAFIQSLFYFYIHIIQRILVIIVLI